jgi:hypothetical protein
MSPRPALVSIVTPVLNAARFLKEAIESVLSQDYAFVEYIVVDGGSTDGTLEILDSYRGRLEYISGKDGGPSDAVHRGFTRARGDILAWLNADDIYLPGAVRLALDLLTAHPNVDVVYGDAYWIDEDGGRIGRYPTRQFDARLLERECFICQPAAFFRAAAYRDCCLNPQVMLPFDYDLWIRMAKRGYHFTALAHSLACSRLHPGALTIRRRKDVFQSTMALLKGHYGYVPLQWVFGYTSYLADGRDQFFEPLRPTFCNYLASLPAGFRYNQEHRFRFLSEWLTTPFRAIARRLGSTSDSCRAFLARRARGR